ncbi:MAG: 2-oxoacid:acceptor oxidoreductase family protein, partial [Gammaproteobacteria bacterium]|nr:2-oxoacid:acceptor oxidoreductase family protein [Gammaproteobacteria bacterium]
MATEALSTRPICVLIGALGGEGGGVLANWIVDAAQHEGLKAQATSVPGVAQRTGATTYYLEIQSHPTGEQPVMALLPTPGSVDLLVASELLEAGRAAQNGMITASRTTVVASTHRFFAMAEKSAMGDGRFDTDRIVDTVREMSSRAVLTDLKAVADGVGTVMSSVLLGAIAALDVLPFSEAALRGAIERAGISVDTNLRGFAAGLDVGRRAVAGEPAGALSQEGAQVQASPDYRNRAQMLEPFPVDLRQVVGLGLDRVQGYQDALYVDSFIERVSRVLEAEREDGRAHDFSVTR